MVWSMVAQVFELVLDVLGLLQQTSREKDLEVLLLREQLRMLERQRVHRPRLSRWDKLTSAVLVTRLKAGTKNSRRHLQEVLPLFKPDTVLKWHRELVRRKWTFSHDQRPAGNAPLNAELEALIVQIALENPKFGYKKLVGELLKLGHRVGRSTVRDVLKRHAIPRASARRRRSSNWQTFLASHKGALLATDYISTGT